MWINKIYNSFLNIIFPVHCIFCGKEGNLICQKCLNSIPIISKPVYPKYNSSLNGIISATHYSNPLIKKAIKYLKYPPYLSPLAKNLSLLLIKRLEDSPFYLNYFINNKFILIPLPLSKKKLAQRGFNQSELLAKEISRKFKIPLVLDVLKKVKPTASQTKLTPKEREHNVKGVFVSNNLNNNKIILVDDVFTTGATLEEAAKTLRQSGAKEIWGLTLARG